MINGPDLQGMEEAQERLREVTGQDVLFQIPGERTWPEGTELDPETGEPYDPQIEPEETDASEVTIKCGVAFRPVHGLAEDTVESPLGEIKQNEVVLIMSVEEWAEVEGATTFEVKGDRYRVKKNTSDGIGSDYRQLVWGERQGPVS